MNKPTESLTANPGEIPSAAQNKWRVPNKTHS